MRALFLDGLDVSFQVGAALVLAVIAAVNGAFAGDALLTGFPGRPRRLGGGRGARRGGDAAGTAQAGDARDQGRVLSALIALGTEAAMAGFRVRYTLATKLVNELVEASDDMVLTGNIIETGTDSYRPPIPAAISQRPNQKPAHYPSMVVFRSGPVEFFDALPPRCDQASPPGAKAMSTRRNCSTDNGRWYWFSRPGLRWQ